MNIALLVFAVPLVLRGQPYSPLLLLARDDTATEPNIEPDSKGRIFPCDHDWNLPASRAPVVEDELLALQQALDDRRFHKTRVVTTMLLASLDGNAEYIGFPLANVPSCGGGNADRIEKQLGKFAV